MRSPQGLPPTGIRVFASQLHTHLTGLAVRTEHVRADGTQLPDLNRDDHSSTHYQEIRLLHEHRSVLPVSPASARWGLCQISTRKLKSSKYFLFP